MAKAILAVSPSRSPLRSALLRPVFSRQRAKARDATQPSRLWKDADFNARIHPDAQKGSWLSLSASHWETEPDNPTPSTARYSSEHWKSRELITQLSVWSWPGPLQLVPQPSSSACAFLFFYSQTFLLSKSSLCLHRPKPFALMLPTLQHIFTSLDHGCLTCGPPSVAELQAADSYA